MTVEQLIGHDASNVSEDNWELLFGALVEGVFSGVNNECRVIPSAPAAMTVEVRTGTFVTGGVFGRVTAQDVLTITAADGANPRIDRIVVRRDNAADAVTLVVLAGTPAGAPVAPALTRAGGVWEISLAQVYVGTGVVQIDGEDVRDERENPALCGYVAGRASDQRTRQQVTGMQQEGFYSASEDNANVRTSGLYGAMASTADGGASAAEDADGKYLNQSTGAVLGQDAFVGVVDVHRRDWHSIFECKFKLINNVDIAFFAGMTSAAAIVVTATDDPVGHHAGVQFSTDRPDTNFQFMVKDGAAQVLVDTGIPIDTDAHFARVSCSVDETEVLIELFDAAHAIEAAYIFTSNIPGLATAMLAVCALDARAGAAKNIRQYYGHGVNRL